MFSSASGDSGIRTDFGGAIQTLTPGGQTIIGVEGVTPGANAGLITQGSSDIQVYSRGSVLLGQSRIITTYGGNIVIWSAEGDINAGRGWREIGAGGFLEGGMAPEASESTLTEFCAAKAGPAGGEARERCRRIGTGQSPTTFWPLAISSRRRRS